MGPYAIWGGVEPYDSIGQVRNFDFFEFRTCIFLVPVRQGRRTGNGWVRKEEKNCFRIRPVRERIESSAVRSMRMHDNTGISNDMHQIVRVSRLMEMLR